MNKVEMPSGIGKSRRRPGQSSSLGHKRATTKFHNYHGNFGSFDGQMAGMGGPEVQTSYGQGYGGDGGYKGRGGYSNRRPGGARGGARAARTCHRSVPVWEKISTPPKKYCLQVQEPGPHGRRLPPAQHPGGQVARPRARPSPHEAGAWSRAGSKERPCNWKRPVCFVKRNKDVVLT